MPGFEIIDKKEEKAVLEIFKDGGVLFAHGFDNLRKNFHVREFEKQLNKYFSSNHALAVSSGTAAIKIGLKALGVGRGDEVITQAFNFVATIEAILDLGAKPIIVNVDSTLNIDINELQKKITKKTKVILPVHMLGVPVDMKKINFIAKKYKLKVLEDNCEATGAKYDGKYCGTIGDVGVLSLDFGKIITTGEGGIIFSQKRSIDKFCREYHDHGHENNPKFQRGNDTKSIIGFNYRMTELQAAIGKVQLKKLNFIIKENKKRYDLLLKSLSKRFEIREIPPNSSPINDTFIFFVRNENEKNRVIKCLADNNFGTKNLPDAIEWHCSYYWHHALNKKQLRYSKTTLTLLNRAIAIPILLKKTRKQYASLAKEIEKIN